MHTAAKLARFGDRMVSLLAAGLILLMLLYGGYSLWDTAMVFQGAFLSSDLLAFKPAGDDPASNPTLEELQAINPDVVGWLTIDDTHIDYPCGHRRDRHGVREQGRLRRLCAVRVHFPGQRQRPRHL